MRAGYRCILCLFRLLTYAEHACMSFVAADVKICTGRRRQSAPLWRLNTAQASFASAGRTPAGEICTKAQSTGLSHQLCVQALLSQSCLTLCRWRLRHQPRSCAWRRRNICLRVYLTLPTLATGFSQRRHAGRPLPCCNGISPRLDGRIQLRNGESFSARTATPAQGIIQRSLCAWMLASPL